MDDLLYGTRNKRGDWTPSAALQPPPVFVLPPRPRAFLAWLPHYFLPWNLLFALSALACWLWIVPPVEAMRTLSWGWPLRLLAVNAAAIFVLYGAVELHLYVRKGQGRRFKYNAKFPAEQKSDVFWFGSQNIDNILRTFLSGVTIWTAMEVLMFWAFARGYAPWVSFARHPAYLAILALAVPVIHEFHFFCIHRLIHTRLLYKWVHSVHHNSVNASPWSSLSMHPVEHVLYFSTIFYHFILPSNPLIALYQLLFAALGAIPGHVGFDKIELGGRLVDSHAYAHYLHHKYFEVNYADGLVPLDRMLGTWHDGSADGEARMQARFRQRKARMAAIQAGKAARKIAAQ